MQRELGSIQNSFLKSVKFCYINEGVKGFYKGMGFPLCSVPLINAIVFAFHEFAKKVFGFKHQMTAKTEASEESITESDIVEGVVCGAFAGWANCFVVTPVELVKCRLQIQHESKGKAYYKGVLDCIVKTYKESGVRGLYQGNIATIMREIPAYSAQFGGYYYAKQLLASYKSIPVDKLNNFDLMLCGAVGGYACWQFSYPQDVIKTLLQTISTKNSENISANFSQQIPNFSEKRSLDGGFSACARYLYNTQGLMGFWRGFLPCTLRALIANAVLFATYENSKALILDLRFI